MKAAYINETGPPETIVFGELPMPVLADDDVLVKVKVVAVDPIDTYIRAGIYKLNLPFPFVIGRDMVGCVEKAGKNAQDFKPGDLVWANNQGYDGRQGTFAEFICVNKEFLYKLPPNSDEKQSVAVLHSALTSWLGLIQKAQLKAGEKLFINGGSGNVGTAVLQMAKNLGAQVAVTAGSKDKAAWCKELGADMVINYKEQSIDEELMKFAPNGVNVFWDATKTPDLNTALHLVAERGRLIVMAGAQHQCQLATGEFYLRNCTLYGFTITGLMAPELKEASNAINQLLQNKNLKTKILDVMPLSQTAKAHALMASGDLFGKILLEP